MLNGLQMLLTMSKSVQRSIRKVDIRIEDMSPFFSIEYRGQIIPRCIGLPRKTSEACLFHGEIIIYRPVRIALIVFLMANNYP